MNEVFRFLPKWCVIHGYAPALTCCLHLSPTPLTQDRPQPFDFGYNVQDEFGNNQFRQEKGDESGSVQGAYGYTDAYGVYRKVHYVADQNGFRADIKTNEPGVKQENPADVQLVVEPPPQGVLQQALTGSRSAGFAKLPAAAPAQPRFPAGLHA
ncbi:hypothetical protein HPB49_019820 [Dermacentor silvarum]|uniref:Uncharacterized protein n=1 Tax=Dermacentor silvarum TaxID=543639 RepID=A0ACB8CB03_DERSI|nr:hypothetical protein HPB49_019820 [Dermacentor silvarum]